MRPIRLELEGFTSFREPTVVDFADADYFALVGPTGSGKSTIIDAICFALYGVVPRYEDKRLVAPVISQGKLVAKVRLDFMVNGTAYTAARIVRRSNKGASTPEARLERAGETVAGNADELSREVAKLLGLSFEHFTRCVVLPQGDFARFLHDDPKDRQDLLVKLLNLGIYDLMRQKANTAASEAAYQIKVLQERLDEDLGFATEQALSGARRSAERLAELRKKISAAAPQIESLAKERQRAEEEAEEAERWLSRLDDLSVPREVAELASILEAARKTVAQRDDGLRTASAALEAATKTYNALPARAPLEAALKAHDRRATTKEKLAAQQARLDEATRTASRAAVAAAEAGSQVARSESALAAARNVNIAAHLATGLAPGDDCPVCLQPVRSTPHHEGTDDTNAAEEALVTAQAAATQAAEAAEAARAHRAAAEATLGALRDQLEELTKDLDQHPDRAAVAASLAAIHEAEEELEAKRLAEAGARAAAQEARAALDDAKTSEDASRIAFEAARDALVPLEPPPAARKDLAEDWAQLLAWARSRRKALSKEAADAGRAASAAGAKLDKLNDALRRSCADCELDVERGSLIEVAVTAHTHALQEVSRIEKAITDAERMGAELKTLRLDKETNHQLAQHLSAKAGMFESWVVGAALEQLVQGANGILRELSDDQYALSVDDKGSFQVVDRHNADETRSARTLSGGETFLTSLALALALADQLAELATEGAAHLDAIFLDEGFGTLDEGTLRTVADTVEKLADGGRMVGIVTHVRELAESVPLQFRVTKDHTTSRVERVPA